MDESAFRHARGEINRLPCVFERVLQGRQAVCEYAVVHRIAERETIACAQPAARVTCGELNGLLREKSAFALRRLPTASVLPHATLMKLQAGGLNGLRDLIDPAALAPDVHRLLRLAKERFGALEALPYAEIMKGIAAWKARRRHGG